MCVNGIQLDDFSVVTALSGYVQQHDIFIGTLTVAEHLRFQARLRMDPDLPKEVRYKKVDEVIREVCV